MRLQKRFRNCTSDEGCHSEARLVVLQEIMPWGFISFPARRWHQSHCLGRKWTSSPSSFAEQAFEILTRGDDERFTIDPPEPSETETAHAMPVLAFGKERLDPDFALVQSFLIGQGLLVVSHPFEIARIEGSMDLPTLITGGTLRFEWTGITGSCICSIFDFLCGILSTKWQERLSLRTQIAIVLGIIAELGRPVEGRHMLPVWSGNVGMDMGILNGFDVLHRSILGVASHLVGVKVPAEDAVPQQIEHRLVVHHFGGGD